MNFKNYLNSGVYLRIKYILRKEKNQFLRKSLWTDSTTEILWGQAGRHRSCSRRVTGNRALEKQAGERRQKQERQTGQWTKKIEHVEFISIPLRWLNKKYLCCRNSKRIWCKCVKYKIGRSPNKRRHKSMNTVKTGSGRKIMGFAAAVIRRTCLCLEGSGGAAAPQFYKLGDQDLEKGRAPRPLSKGSPRSPSEAWGTSHRGDKRSWCHFQSQAWGGVGSLLRRNLPPIKLRQLRKMDSNMVSQWFKWLQLSFIDETKRHSMDKMVSPNQNEPQTSP